MMDEEMLRALEDNAMSMEEYENLPFYVSENNDMDYIPGYDDGEWDPVMGDGDEWIETDDEWLDDFQGEEDFA
jgi:hypothetical protein